MRLSQRPLLLLTVSALGLAACKGKPSAGSAGTLASVAVSGGGVTIDVIATETWPGGFTGAVRVTNSSFPTPITSFSIVFKLGGTATIQGSGWNGTLSAPDASGNRTCLSPGWLQHQPIRSDTSWDERFTGGGTFAGATIVSVTINGQVIPIGNGGDTTPPTVAIQSNIATVTTPSTISLAATASDDVGVARVDFYDGATLLGSTTFAPYVITVPLTAADNGTHAYVARAFDAANNSATSSPANVTVDIPPRDTTPPTVYLVSSAVNVTTASTITLTATAADDVGVARVEFYEGTTLLGSRTNAPYELPIYFTSPESTAHTYTARAFDAAGNSGTSVAVIVTVQIQEPDLVPPTVALTSNVTSVTAASTVTLTATATDDVGVARVDFYEGTTLLGTRSSAPYELFISFTSADNGAHTYTARAFDTAGNSATSSAVNVTVDIQAPDTVSPAVSLAASATNVTTASTVTLIATASDDVGVARVEFYEGATLLGTRASAPYELAIAFTSADNGVHTYTARAFDDAENRGTSTPTSITVAIGSGTWVPPDPATVAPPNDLTVATDIAAATKFLYTGSNPIQVGVPEGTIEARRVAIVRGQVTARGGVPIEAVTVSVLGHPEFGNTRTRADGRFDLAVNGGGSLTIEYRKDGYLPAQRQVRAPWRDYVAVDSVVLVAYDTQRTEVQFGAQAMQVARGSQVVDGDGSRQATVLFPAGTQATVTLPDGSTAPLGTVHVRATEYTVGEDGPRAMPAALPATSAYTYAVELSIDEVEAVGATAVQFDRPVPLYVENFLGFAVGGRVPTGYYDRTKGVWVPSEDGKVIRILGTTDGLADLDVDGDAVADTGAKLATLGVTDAERARLAVTYPVGTGLWRVPLRHFSPWDCNWPYGCDGDECPAPDPEPPISPEPDPDPECESGSIIDCNNQALGESVEIMGTPYLLHYSSMRVPGRTTERTTKIPLSGDSVPLNVQGLELVIEVAGQTIRRSFPPLPNQTFSFTWDGLDGYGRPVQGTVDAKITIGWVYRSVYLEPSVRSGSRSFAAMSDGSGGGGGGVFVPMPTREAATPFWRTRQYTVKLTSLNSASAFGLGGWTLDVVHRYDATYRGVLLGDGRLLAAATFNRNRVSTFAGTGQQWLSGDGGPAKKAALHMPMQIAGAPDGSLYIPNMPSGSIRKVSPDGIITTVAGGRAIGFGGDGGPATSASFRELEAVAVGPDGSLYIADTFNYRIRRVTPDGIVSTFAGNGSSGRSGDGGPATAAAIGNPWGVTVGPDGSVYIADDLHNVIRKVDPGGVISTTAGTGYAGYGGDGGPATKATLYGPQALAVGPDGSLYVADRRNQRVRRVGVDGIIHTVAGTGAAGFNGDGGLATAARLKNPLGIAVGPDGTLYIADSDNYRVRAVLPNGVITTIAGDGAPLPYLGDNGDDGPSQRAHFAYAVGVAMLPDGVVLVSDVTDCRIRAIHSPFPRWSASSFLVTSQDGGQVFEFDSSGRHLTTLDSRTNVILYSLGYDDAGRLTSVTDRDGLVTRVEWSAGVPSAILAPHGQRTALSLDPNGYLSAITSPALEAHRYTYDANGLMRTFTDARGNVHEFRHDALGRLLRDEGPAGGFKELSRTERADGYLISLTTALQRTTLREVRKLDAGDWVRTRTMPDGTAVASTESASGTKSVTYAEGTVRSVTFGPDPQFGMQSALVSRAQTTTPSGLSLVTAHSASVGLDTPGDVLAVRTRTDQVSVNGRTFASTYAAATKTVTSTTASGRTVVTSLNERGRPSELQQPGMATISVSYDAQGRPQTISQGVRFYTFGYDAGGYLQTITDPLGRVVGFSRDAAGRIVSQSLPGGRTVTHGYDPNGNVTALSPPGRPAHAFQHTPVDLTSSYDPPAVAGLEVLRTSYSYDLDGAPAQVLLPDDSAIVPAYDFAGRLASVTTSRGTSTLGYDAVGRLETITASSGALAYTHDGPLVTSETATGPTAGNVGWTYDNDFRVTSTSVNGTSVSYQYDADSLLTAAGALGISRDAPTGRITGTSLDSVTTTHGYNEYGELASITASASSPSLYGFTLTRDLAGRITGKTETVQGVTTSYEYGYDDAGRLETVRRDGQQVASYLYDENGNRLSETTAGGSQAGTYDAQDRMLAYGSATFSYRPNGELASRTIAGQATWYDYDALGNLRGVVLPDGRHLEYVVDGRNRRVGRKVNGALLEGFLYEGKLRPVAWLNDAGQVYARFVYGLHVNVPEYMVVGSTTYRFVTDHLGSPRLIVNAATGAVVQRIDYDEWGQVLADSNPGFQPFGFAGGLYDRDTGLVRFGARDYDPSVGRWTSKDPVRFRGGDTNLYAYTASNPVNETDPTGLWVAGLGVGGGFSFVWFGGEVSVQLVVDSQGAIGVMVSPAVRAGPQLGLDAGGTGFLNWQADSIKDMDGFGGGINLALGVATVGAQATAAERPISCGTGPDGPTQKEVLWGASASGGAGATFGLYGTAGESTVWQLPLSWKEWWQ